jgi:hypothetical protein
MTVIPTPLGEDDRTGGYRWELSMRQVEISRTLVFDAPRHGRVFFEAMVADNLDVGRPNQVRLIFGRRIQSNTKGTFATRVVTRGTDVTVDVNYRDSRTKQYLKEGHALRIETVVNSPNDLGCQRRPQNLDELQAKARAANRRFLEVQRIAQSCAISTRLPRAGHTALTPGGPTNRSASLRGSPRHGPGRHPLRAGARHRRLHQSEPLRPRESSLLDGPYTSAQMTYDLGRLRLKGLIRRLEATNTYVLTPDGTR